MRARLLATLFVGAMMPAIMSASAVAATYICPPPSQITCVPALKSVAGWVDNNGQTTGNTFMPNNQCANVIPLGPGKQRLLCCYAKCGVFLRDVEARMCTKVSEREFECR